jgi:CheY-like chemotaxis protein
VAFEVADTGAGMSPEDLTRVFHPFEQAVTGRPPEPGAGLGLAISQRLAALLGSRIEAVSRPGEGSRFSLEVSLPAAGAVAVEHAGRVVGYEGERRRILGGDDLEVNRRLVRELLEPVGFEVREAGSGEAALAALAAAPAHAVILDLRMPGMDGFELARRLAALPGGGPLRIATSASVFSFNRDSAREAGCHDFLPKPYREEQLFEILGTLLQLVYRHEAVPAAAPMGDGVPEAPTLAQWLALASRGDVVALREALAAHRSAHPDHASFVAALEGDAAEFRMGAIRERLRGSLPQ